MCLLGFTPQIQQCTNCHTKEELNFFSMNSSGFKCKNCAKVDKSCIELGEASINAIKYIVLAPDKKVFSFQISEQAQKELGLISKLYTNLKLEKEYKMDN